MAKLHIKKNSIGLNIGLATGLMTLIFLVLFGIIACASTYSSVKTTVLTDMEHTVEVAAERADWELQSFLHISEGMGLDPALSDENITNDEIQALLTARAEKYGLERGNFIDINGIGLDGNNYSDREYFQTAMNGTSSVSEPVVSKITGKTTIIVAAPVWKDGIVDSSVVGVVYFVPNEEFLNEIVRDIKISPNSDAYIIDRDGNTIAAEDMSRITEGENMEVLAANDKNYKDIAEINAKMRTGESGVTTAKCGSKLQVFTYTGINGSDGWSICLHAPVADFMTGFYQGLLVMVIMVIVFSAITVFLAFKQGIAIGRPIRLCTERLTKLAAGDLTSDVPQNNRKDEVGLLARTTNDIVRNMQNIIGDVTKISQAFANGRMDIDVNKNKNLYPGDYKGIIIALNEAKNNMTQTLSGIVTAADQVSAGSEQVSEGAQALSQGATEQASSVQELAATISVISGKINENAEDAAKANDDTAVAKTEMAAVNEKTSELVSAMSEIRNSSEEIKKINKTIEDIAFQTNILALNAAVEAARAGAAGKGFAVVADEVRNLATKSDEATKQTAAIIRETIEAIENGSTIVDETERSMAEVVVNTDKTNELIDRISEASQDQAEAIRQITDGIAQVSEVVQQNSATAEESAASSEELSGQAAILMEQVAKFKV